jgi:hypothetical protein
MSVVPSASVGARRRAFGAPASHRRGGVSLQGSGPAGTNGDITNGVFASTNDVALLADAGVRLGQRLFLEARMVTVGDFRRFP